jgi:signal transduction histidine kinase
MDCRSPPPSIAARLSRAILGWALAWGLAVGLAVWLAATHEVDELLDEALRSSAELMAVLVAEHDEAADATAGIGAVPAEHFAWQLVAADGRVLRRSVKAPQAPWHGTPKTGYADVPGWRIYGLAAGRQGQFLYAAQTRVERDEARGEVAFGAVLSALAVGLLGQLWLRARVRHEMEPLQALSQRLEQWQLGDGPASSALGPPARQELAAVHQAIEGLAVRLAARLTNEQAFSAHAAHALRTPLAGIDAQLAVAARSAPPELAERLVRVRSAAARLQHVVAALLGLFRSADGTASLQRGTVRLDDLVTRLPPFALAVQVPPGTTVHADADLLLAALLNLLDNAQRHGAKHARIEVDAGTGVLRLADDGPGVTPGRREQLAQALAEERYADTGGLGLMLADRVARAHGGRVTLPSVAQGFAVALDLGVPPADAP